MSGLPAFLRSWPSEPWLCIALLVTTGVYLRGWIMLARRGAGRWPFWRLAAFVGGIVALFLALASPIDVFAAMYFQVHMLQHLLLMIAAPPLLWLGAPLVPILRGLPVEVRRVWVAPLLRWPPLRAGLVRLTHPVVAWGLFVAANWVWHLPSCYEAALRSPATHYLEHACFFWSGLLFWWPVMRPYPARWGFSRWVLMPYLLLAEVQNTLLAALLTFAPRPLYPTYAALLGPQGALDDQAAAGVLMWVPMSLVLLFPLGRLTLALLFGELQKQSQRSARERPGVPSVSEIVPPLVTLHRAYPRAIVKNTVALDVLRAPLVGRWLRWPGGRRVMQSGLLVLAGLIVADGFWGPPIAPLNLAGVLPWIHWRGLLVIVLLAAGNFFCTACPFMLTRALGKRWGGASRHWPRRLRSKWLAVALLIGFFIAYEGLALWDDPWLTAWIIVGYFVASLVVDGLFRDAAFCKYLCPVGQFNFVQSLVSPLEVRVRDAAVCAGCTTHDCLRGNATATGCETQLFLPHKASNLDCTFCLQCVDACPEQNVGLLFTPPASELWRDTQRSGVGRFSTRVDLAALVLVLVFAAFLNAAGMVGPVLDGFDRAAAMFQFDRSLPLLLLSLLLGLTVLPWASVTLAGWIGSRWSGLSSVRESALRFSYALVPLGAAMWVAHYLFHFVGSFDQFVPAAQRALADVGLVAWQSMGYVCDCCAPAHPLLLQGQVLLLQVGMLTSLYVAFRIARENSAALGTSLKLCAPWAILIGGLFIVGVWILMQPMQMRGASVFAG